MIIKIYWLDLRKGINLNSSFCCSPNKCFRCRWESEQSATQSKTEPLKMSSSDTWWLRVWKDDLWSADRCSSEVWRCLCATIVQGPVSFSVLHIQCEKKWIAVVYCQFLNIAAFIPILLGSHYWRNSLEFQMETHNSFTLMF